MSDSIPHFPAQGQSGAHPIQGALCPIVSENISMSSSSTTTTIPFTYPIIRVVSDTDCYVVLGTSGAVAKAGNTMLLAGAIEYFNVQASTFLAAIPKSGSSGIVNVTQMG